MLKKAPIKKTILLFSSVTLLISDPLYSHGTATKGAVHWLSDSHSFAEKQLCDRFVRAIEASNQDQDRSSIYETISIPGFNKMHWRPADPRLFFDEIVSLFAIRYNKPLQGIRDKPNDKYYALARAQFETLMKSKQISADVSSAQDSVGQHDFLRVRWPGWTGGTIRRPRSGASAKERFQAIIVRGKLADEALGSWPIFTNSYPSLDLIQGFGGLWMINASELQIRELKLISNSEPEDNPLCEYQPKELSK